MSEELKFVIIITVGALLTLSFFNQRSVGQKICIDGINHYVWRIDEEPKLVLTEILENFETRVTDFPLGCHICPKLLKVVCSKCWKYKTNKGYKLLYSVDDSALAVMLYFQKNGCSVAFIQMSDQCITIKLAVWKPLSLL
ncbi:hypothetical protein RBA71_11060 [Brenneria goodwinii]|uniref:hypothetical protein n=1 Tax=Brenneria goodwinii TaxID=1109412 RepID=UPI0036E212DC